MTAREVAWLWVWERPLFSRSGTAIMPPPAPNSPFASPAIIPPNVDFGRETQFITYPAAPKEFLLSNDDAFSLIEENLQREEGPSDGGTQIYKSIKGSEFSSKGFTYIRCNRLDGSNTDIYIGPIELTYQNNFCN